MFGIGQIECPEMIGKPKEEIVIWLIVDAFEMRTDNERLVIFELIAQFLLYIVIPEPSHLSLSFPSALPHATDLLQVKDVEEGIGHNRIAPSRTARRAIRTTRIGIAMLQHIFGKVEHCIQVCNIRILIDIDRYVTVGVVKHCEEIAIGCLVSKSHTRIACTLEQLSCLFIELKRERSCVELHASCAQQWTF